MCRGVVMRRWRPLTSDLQCTLEMALSANHIQVLNEQKSGMSVTEEMVRECLAYYNILYVGPKKDNFVKYKQSIPSCKIFPG